MEIIKGKLQGIAIRKAKRSPMQKLDKAFVSLSRGVEEDFRGKPGNRQVTVLSSENWQEACAEVGHLLEWTTRRANLLIDTIKLEKTSGYFLALGDDLILQITGETDPCERMEESCAGLERALTPNWRGGVTCKVIREGHIKISDSVRLFHDLSKFEL